MEDYKIKILKDDTYIGYASSDYLYTNILDFDNPVIENVEDGKVILRGKYYYMYNNGNVLLYKPSYNIDNSNLIHKDGKSIVYEKITSFDNYFRPITMDNILLQFPNIPNSNFTIEKDDNGNYMQRINLKIEVYGGDEKCNYGDFIQYDIKDEKHIRIPFNNGLYVDYLTLKSKENGYSLYEISIVNYGRITLDDDNYYILPIYHNNSRTTICRIKFVFESNIKKFSVKINNFLYDKKDKININFKYYGGTERIPIETNLKDVNIINKLYWIKAYVNNNSINIECDKNTGEKREGSFKFGYGRNLYTVLVVQEKSTNYKIITNRKKIKVNGKKIKVLIHVNSLYGKHNINIENKCNWIHCDVKKKLDGKYYTTFDIMLNIDKNLTYQDRNDYIKIYHSDDYNIFDIIDIYQTYLVNDFDKFISIKDDIIIDYMGNERIFNVELFPFIDCKFSINRKPSWMMYEIIDNNKLKIYCEKNLFTERDAILEIINDDFPFNPLIKHITQKGKKG